jgi:hypothetical protein
VTAAAALQAAAAVILVFVTGYYAKMTRDLAGETRKMANAMKTAQERAEELRRRERSERAALSALESLRSDNLGRGAGVVEQALADDVGHVLRWESSLVDDAEVQSRMRACSGVALVIAWSDESFEPERTTRGQASLRLHNIATATRATLEAYLTEQALPEWVDLPEPAGAQAWALRPLN